MTNKSTRILIVDDDEDDFFITSECLRQVADANFQIDWRYRLEDAVEDAKARTYDIYFVDYRLGKYTGLDFLKRAAAVGCEEPIVLLTGKGTKEIDIKAMQEGATDYLVKTDLNPDKLERCIRYALDRSASLKALRANEKKYRAIFELSKEALFLCNASLRFLATNAAADELFGHAHGKLLMLTLYDFISEEETLQSLQAGIAEGDDITEEEIEIVNAEGEKRILLLSLTATPERDGETQWQGLLHDITNLRKAEKANLMTEKLGAAGRLVRTLAHEVRNPLNNINMSVEQLSAETLPEEAGLYLDIIQRNSNRISGLITELLDSSRPSELQFEQLALQTLLDEAIADALDRITLQRISLKIRYHSEPCLVLANREKLKIAFLNIIINAVEAMPSDGSGELQIEVENADDEYTVMVSDNGSGIHPEALPRLFEPYFTSKRNGMGLGLASTLNILQSHKATVDVTSEVDKGTQFTIVFPAN